MSRYSKRTRYASAPVAVTSIVNQQAGQRSITLRGREFIKDVVAYNLTAAPGVSRYEVSAQRVSPTDTSLFTWLTTIAEKFEEYRFQGLAFTYEPQCTTNTTGCIGIYFDGDPSNTPPASWATLTNTGTNTHGACWAKHQLMVPGSYIHDRKTYYVPDQYVDASNNNAVAVRSNNQTAPIDPLEYYVGSVGVSTIGVLSTGAGSYQSLGKLYMDYSITLSKATIDTVPRNAFTGANNAGAAAIVPTGQQVSNFLASVSGTGYFLQLPTVPVAIAVNANHPLIGTSDITNAGTVAALSSRWGDELWQWNTSTAGGGGAILAQSNVTALSSINVSYCVVIEGAALNVATNNIRWRFENKDNVTSTLSTYFQAFDSWPATAVNNMAFGTITLQAGERISLIYNKPAGATITQARVWLSPFTWGLDR